jgi:uncharacterized protein
MTIVVDTSALIATTDASDQHHAAALRALDLVDDRPVSITNYVVSETLSLASRRLGMQHARDIQLHAIRAMEILWTTPLEHAAAVEAFLETGRSLSFVDCATMATMRARGLTTIFTFDEDFRRAGFEVVP